MSEPRKIHHYPNQWAVVDGLGEEAHLFRPLDYPRVRPLCMVPANISMWAFDEALRTKKSRGAQRCLACKRLAMEATDGD